MQNLGRVVGCLVVASVLPVTAVTAAPQRYVSEQVKALPDGRAVQVLVAQSEIATDINPSNLAVATGGGILGGLLAASQNASRAKQAEAAIEPVRATLAGFDADSLALETTKTGLGGVSWVRPTKIQVSKDGSQLNRSAILDASGGTQVMFVDYTYDLSPDFRSVRVGARIQIANRALPAGSTDKPESRVSRHLVSDQFVRGVVTLPNVSDKKVENAALWSANNGQAVRSALTTAFRMVGTLMPKTLAVTQADIKAMKGKDKPKAVAGGMGGRVQNTGPDGVLLWADGFVQEQTLAQ